MLTALIRNLTRSLELDELVRRLFPRRLFNRLPARAATFVAYSLMGLRPVMGGDGSDDGGGGGNDDGGGDDGGDGSDDGDDGDDDGDDGDDGDDELSRARKAAADAKAEVRKLKRAAEEREAEAKRNAGKHEELYKEEKAKREELEEELERIKTEHEDEKRQGAARTLALAELREAKAHNPDAAVKHLDLEKIDTEAKAKKAVEKLTKSDAYLFEKASTRQKRGGGEGDGSSSRRSDDDGDGNGNGKSRKDFGPGRLRRHFAGAAAEE